MSKCIKKGAPLSKRELQVLKLICKESTPKTASDRLGINEKTYFNHRSNLLVKTGSQTNVGIYRFALKNGIIKLK
ncbi:MAG: response regulator transcription factor [Bacteroidetes bacterium]|nr:response regulator transcription factor [Bacteroidota bacterium]